MRGSRYTLILSNTLRMLVKGALKKTVVGMRKKKGIASEQLVLREAGGVTRPVIAVPCKNGP